jgi:hypothetical protein
MSNELTNKIINFISQGKIKECIDYLDTPENYIHAVNLSMKNLDRKGAYDLCLKYRDYEFLTFLEKQYYKSVVDESENYNRMGSHGKEIK